MPTKVEQNTAVLDLGGMTCSSCAVRIEKALGRVPGVGRVAVNFATEQAHVGFNASEVRPHDLIRAVEDEGYEAKLSSLAGAHAPPPAISGAVPEKVTLDITGMHCASCLTAIEGALR